jgi:uncharacterized RDD family membrane protein YckC
MTASHGDAAVPLEARSFQRHRAGIVTRTAANVVDSAVALAIVAGGYAAWCVVTFLIRPRAFRFPAPAPLALLACWAGVLFVYFTASWATTGRSYGDHLLGLRVVDSEGERLTWAAALARSAFCVLVPIGLYWAVVSPTNRSLQDTVLRTSVLYDWTTRRPAPAAAGHHGARASGSPGGADGASAFVAISGVTQAARTSGAISSARTTRVIGTASRAPRAPSKKVHSTSERNVISALRPTVAPTYRGWMNVWIVTFKAL